MVEVDDNDAMMDSSWLSPNPSSRTLLSNPSNGSRSFSTFLLENGNLGLPWSSENQKVNVSSRIEGEVGVNSLNDLSPQPKLFGDPRSSSFGGLAERMATRKGFNVPKLDTANIQSTSMVSSSETPSPYLTIPPGLSPTALLESPGLFSDTLDQPSPITGKFEFLENIASNAMPVSCLAAFAKSECNIFEDISDAFPFKTHIESDSHHSRLVKKLELPSIEGYVQMENLTEERKVEASSENFRYQPEFCIQSGSFMSDRKNTTNNAILNQHIADTIMVSDQQNREACPRREFSAALGTPAEDGYNWRKYGQKQVKGSENPRSYYKCTHPNCQMKKKVERSHEGRITEIIYKGSHNHLKPNLDCQFSVPSTNPLNELQSDGSEQPDSQASFDEKPIKGSSRSVNGCRDCLGDGLEATSAAPIAAEFCDASNTLQENQDGDHPSPGSIDVSSTMSNDEDDRETHGSISLCGDGDGDETESRSRKLDSCVVEINAASRTIREPRVVIQIMSDIDILDDGYRWRKYGQKVVKGNPNPRSYYKCTNPGCSVRKHIERASHDLKSVITTYEGTHNHEVPMTRRSSHQNSGSSIVSSSNSANQSHSLLQKHEPMQDRFTRFNSRTPLRTLNFPQKGQLGTATSFPFAMGQPSLSNLSMSGFNPMAAASMPIVPPVHSFPNHGHPTEAGYMMHKVDLKEELLPDTFLPLSNSMSVYHQMMSKPTCVVECRSKDGYSSSQV